MAEFCLDCLNKMMGTNDPPGKYIISKEPDLCEGCGQFKPVIIQVRQRGVAEWFSGQMVYFVKRIRK